MFQSTMRETRAAARPWGAAGWRWRPAAACGRTAWGPEGGFHRRFLGLKRVSVQPPAHAEKSSRTRGLRFYVAPADRASRWPFPYFEVKSKLISLSPDFTSAHKFRLPVELFRQCIQGGVMVPRFGDTHGVLPTTPPRSSRKYFRTKSSPLFPSASVRAVDSRPPPSGLKMTSAPATGLPSSVTWPRTCPKAGRSRLPPNRQRQAGPCRQKPPRQASDAAARRHRMLTRQETIGQLGGTRRGGSFRLS